MAKPLFQEKHQAHESYHSAWEHISDELILLDLNIQLCLAYKQTTDNSDHDHLKGLVLFEAEIINLLADGNHTIDEDYVESLKLQVAAQEKKIQYKVDRSLEQHVFLPLIDIARHYQLTKLEVKAMVIALAFDIDRKYEKLFAYLHDDVTCKRPSVDLVLKLTGSTAKDISLARDIFADQTIKRTYLFVFNSDHAEQSFMARPFRLDQRIGSFLLGSSQLDDRIAEFAHIHSSQHPVVPLFIGQTTQERMEEYMHSQEEGEDLLFFHLWGGAGAGKKLQVKQFCQSLNKHVLFIDSEKMVHSDVPFKELIAISIREAVLQKAVLCFYQLDVLLKETEKFEQQIRQFITEIKKFQGIVFFLSHTQLKPFELMKHHTFIDIPVHVPMDRQREQIWNDLAKPYPVSEGVDWGAIASKFRFTYGQIERAIQTAHHIADWEKTSDNSGTEINERDIHQACYMQIQHKLEQKAVRISPKYSWDDLVLPPEPKQELYNACNQIKYRHIVYDQWGFDRKLAYGKGLSMLFSGPPGTGKTMSAQIIAQELDLEIYKIDLSRVISKYIGETEKNLHEIFTEAQYSHAILFFDETDALFGKRSEVKDSHDKYANIETSYLLQKMEDYEGICVLASNYIQNIDDAFMRRINFIIKYPFPDRTNRELIWKTSFPVETPLAPDIDFKFLSEKFDISGGYIKNIVVSAAFLAAEKAEPIAMKHIMKATKHEVKKTGKIFSDGELDGY